MGAGDQDHIEPSIICSEIVGYKSTDVLAVGQRLPFADASFDGVFSSAVLEHVTDPFACAEELMRVLKPSGRIFCSVPFLQPEHGYPLTCPLRVPRSLREPLGLIAGLCRRR